MIRGGAVTNRGGAGGITHETLHERPTVDAAQAACARERAMEHAARVRFGEHGGGGDEQVEHRQPPPLGVQLDGARGLGIDDLEDPIRLDQRNFGAHRAGMADAFGEGTLAVQLAQAMRRLFTVGLDDAHDAGLAGTPVDGAPERGLGRAADLLQKPESQVGRAGLTRRIAFNGSDRHVIPLRAM